MFNKKKSWPDCDAPDKTNSYWEWESFSINGVQYERKEVSSDKWQWVVDEQAEKLKTEEAGKKRLLWEALNTRALTPEEMKKASGYGSWLNLQEMVPYSGEEKATELQTAWIKQGILQNISENSVRKADT